MKLFVAPGETASLKCLVVAAASEANVEVIVIPKSDVSTVVPYLRGVQVILPSVYVPSCYPCNCDMQLPILEKRPGLLVLAPSVICVALWESNSKNLKLTESDTEWIEWEKRNLQVI
jgi:hypothetical protein